MAIPEASTKRVAEAAAGQQDALSFGRRSYTSRLWVKCLSNLSAGYCSNDIAEKTYGRMQRLYDEGVMSAQKRDEAMAAYEATKAGVQVAKSQWNLLRMVPSVRLKRLQESKQGCCSFCC